jgi:hypothetical protein
LGEVGENFSPQVVEGEVLPVASGRGGVREGAGRKRIPRLDVRTMLREMNFDPIAKLVDLANNSRSEKIQLAATTDLLSYCAPKMRLHPDDAQEMAEGFAEFFAMISAAGRPKPPNDSESDLVDVTPEG